MTNPDKLIKIVKVIRSLDERLSPMTYKKLNELGVKPEQRKGWSQEQANQYIQNHSKTSGTGSKTEKETSKGKTKNRKNASVYRKPRPKTISPDDKRITNIGESGGIPAVKGIPGSSAMLDNKLITKSGQKLSADAQKRYDQIRESEKETTDSLLDIGDNIGLELENLELNTKTGSSLANKVLTKRAKEKEGLSPGAKAKSDVEWIDDMGDIIRYTYMSDHNELGNNAKKVVNQLQKKGYTVIEVDNKYTNGEPGYKAIHLSFLNKAGVKCEIQMHSEEELKIKDKSHALHKKENDTTLSDEERKKAHDEGNRLWQYIQAPKNIKNVKSFKMSNDEIKQKREEIKNGK